LLLYLINWHLYFVTLLQYCQADSGHHKATEEEVDPGTPEKEIWRKKCGQQVSGTAGGIWQWKHKTELDEDKWFVAYDPRGLTRHKSSYIT